MYVEEFYNFHGKKKSENMDTFLKVKDVLQR